MTGGQILEISHIVVEMGGGVYSGRERWILGGSHIVAEGGGVH